MPLSTRKISTDGRRRISAAMKARWAKVKAAQQPAAPMNGHAVTLTVTEIAGLAVTRLKELDQEREILLSLIQQTAVAQSRPA